MCCLLERIFLFKHYYCNKLFCTDSENTIIIFNLSITSICILNLRWRMIEEVGTFFLSSSKLNATYPLKNNQKDISRRNKAKTKNKKNSYVSDEESRTSASTSSSNSATDQADQVKKGISSPLGTIDKHSNNNNNSNNSMILTEYERFTLNCLSPYFNGASSLHDIAWLEKIQEVEILRLVKKNSDILVFYV